MLALVGVDDLDRISDLARWTHRKALRVLSHGVRSQHDVRFDEVRSAEARIRHAFVVLTPK